MKMQAGIQNIHFALLILETTRHQFLNCSVSKEIAFSLPITDLNVNNFKFFMARNGLAYLKANESSIGAYIIIDCFSFEI